MRDQPIAAMLDEEAGRAAAQPQRESSWPYAREIVEGVESNLSAIDAAIIEHAQGWTLERMPALDRAIARMAAWEILYNDEVPDGVAIAEAVEVGDAAEHRGLGGVPQRPAGRNRAREGRTDDVAGLLSVAWLLS